MNENLPIRLSVTEAAKLFGVSTKTIRQAIKNNELVYIVTRARYKINFESLLLWSQMSTRRNNFLSNQGIGQYVEKWRIRAKKYSPNKELLKKIIQSDSEEQTHPLKQNNQTQLDNPAESPGQQLNQADHQLSGTQSGQ